jgi:N-acetylmuramic acid 6-phosphate etherase
MKAGTAQKAALNILTTGVMVKLGYVWRGKMVEMRPTNAKLQRRAEAMVAELTDAAPDAARAALEQADGAIKLAVVMLTLSMDAPAARAHLAQHGGILGAALAGQG